MHSDGSNQMKMNTSLVTELLIMKKNIKRKLQTNTLARINTTLRHLPFTVERNVL